MYDDILVTTDGSEGSEAAVEDALEIAKRFNSTIHILYVVDVRAGAQDMADVMVGKFEEIGEEATTRFAEKFEEEDIEVETHVESGIPHRSILEFTDENSIDLIVMSTHGRTGLDRILIGSVTEKVIRKSEVPVLTVGRS